ncbi:ABC transporter permease subunit [Paenibacillus pasadenensis]|uniref:ABC transporter permease subunit n=1 Tax=Paenibacillus pasadenensis TaxID=217090 RepID=UPI002041FFBA|nr:ABC transporter permease subunit [Paenibacillus pasadenensis]MCM3749651.1 ABC transporter permease subunit [Paenibacillus pasadenensis]
MSIIWSLTWKELMRKRVVLLTGIMTAAFLIALWFIASAISNEVFGFGLAEDDPKFILEMFARGMLILSLAFFFGGFVIAFLSIFSSSSAISGEAELGVLQALAPKPLARWQWYAGRWLGFVSFGLVYALILFTAIIAITGYHASVPRDPANLISAYLFFGMIVVVLVTLSMLGSTFFSGIGNGVFVTMLYGGGWLGGMIEKVITQVSSLSTNGGGKLGESLSNIAGLLSLAMPADGLHRMMLGRLFNVPGLSELIGMKASGQESLFGIGAAPTMAFLWYALLYTAAAFAFGAWRFQRKDL